ncbi:type 1 glutamine amidotransferase [Pseudomonas luteola]|uniref:type 1 glutamine amidotransferase domain-containing protein n=1 Tax=Pseudomonas luteola TaxID=47886 RepID=UPI003DA109E8
MMASLEGKKVAILVTDGFEQAELTGPKEALEKVGAKTHIISAKSGTVQGWNHTDPADTFNVDLTFDAANIGDYDAVVLPGGVVNSDTIRTDERAQTLVKEASSNGKPIAVICHGAWLLISAGLVDGKTMTSWPSLTDDLKNAGAQWVDKEVVVDGKLVSSRKPDDIPAFNRELINMIAA